MRKFTSTHKLFTTTILLAIAMLFTNAAFSQASVSTDQADYPPGSTVIIAGSGFQPGESVKLQVLHFDAYGDNDTSAAHQPWYVTADSTGNINTTWTVPPDQDELGATLKLTADGQSSFLHAETLFTDAGGTLNLSSNARVAASICAGSTNVPIHSFAINGNGSPDAITSISFVTTGTYNSSEIVNFKLYQTGSTNTFSTTNLLSTITTPSAAGTQTFSLNFLNGNGTVFYWITMDVASSVTNNNTIAVNGTVNSNILAGLANVTGGPTNASGTQTLISPPTTSNAGTEQTICPGSTTTLAGNNPSVGTGTWSVTSGPSTASSQFASTGIFNTTFTPAGGNGTYVLRWTISNSPCSSSFDEVNIVVADNTPPTVTPTSTASTSLGCNASAPTINAALGSATAFDNCSGVLTPTASDGVVGSTDCARSQTRTWTATDAAGNTATASRTVAWTFDITNPVVTPTATASTALGCNPTSATIDAALGETTASDNCSGVLTPTSSDGAVGSTGCARSQTRTWTATDACGNAGTTSRTVTWTFDQTSPVITPISSESTSLGCNPDPEILEGTLGSATASDNCDGALTPTASDGAVGSTGCARSQTRTWTATDACGNVGTASRTVTWTFDITSPDVTPTVTASTSLGCNPSSATIDLALGGATASDNCSGALTPTASDGAVGNTGCARSQTRTWTATDACGNVGTGSRTVSWTFDITNPVVAPTATASTSLGCNPSTATIDGALGGATASDNCSGALTPTASDGVIGSTGCARSQTKTWTATDACGNVGTASRTVSWTFDITNPVVTPTSVASTALGCNPSSATIDATLGGASAWDNCSGALTPTSSDGAVGSTGCARSQTRTWSATDACGNVGTASRTVTWTFDITAPVVTPSSTASTALGCNPSTATIDGALGGATANDNCDGALTPTSSDGAVGSTGCARSQTRTWSATDACGNVGTASRTVTWTFDITAPVVIPTSTASTALGCNPSTATIDGALGGATASDNCSGALTPTASDGAVGSTGCARSQTRTWSATDACGNVGTASRTVTWTFDITAPVVTPSSTASTALGCNPSTATIDGALGGATVSDNCSGALTPTASDGAIGSTGCTRSQTRTWTATDACGNVGTASRTVSWTFDITKPVVTPTSVASTALGCNPSSATIDATLGGATASDNCSGALTPTASDGAIGSTGCARSQTRTWTATDACGNVGTASRTVSWTFDITNPVVTPTATASTSLGCNPSATTIDAVLGGATASDNCSSALTPTASDGAEGSTGCARSQTRTWTATDACGNVGTASRTVSWTFDITKPDVTPTATGSTALGCNPSGATINTALGGATASDNCGGALTPTASDGAIGSTGCARSQTRTWSATDACGNVGTASRTVTWTFDITAPVVTPTSATSTALGCNPSTATIDAALGGATASDNCSGSLTPTASDGAVGSTGCARSQTRTWSATDACGNVGTASRTVSWTFDITPPSITAASTAVATNSGLCTYTIVGAQFDATASDNCGGAVTLKWQVSGATTNTNASNASTLAGVVLNFGLNTVLWTAIEGCGNTSTNSVTINVNTVTATTTVSVSPNPRQYSDSVRFIATVTNCSGAGNIGGNVTFYVSGVNLGTAPVATDGTATLDAVLLEPSLDPNNPTNGPLKPSAVPKTVLADFSGYDADYVVTDPTTTLTITQENAIVSYNGFEYFTTPNSSCPATGTINLSGYVMDTADNYRGDIRNATVTFTDQFNAPYPNSSNLAVGLINPGDYQQGIATSSFPMTLSGSDCNNAGKTFEVWTKVNNYYTGATTEGTLITLALPGQENVTGGGHLNITNSAGCLAATLGSKMNFGFTMKWNKSGKNLQGQINIMFRKYVSGQWRTYQMKSNAINSMSIQNITVSGINYNVAYISTKANLTDVTDPNTTISLGGNLDLSLEVWDCTQNTGGQLDKIGVSLVGSVTGCTSNSLIFSSFFANGATLAQLLNGGNINIRSNNTSGGGSTRTELVTTEQIQSPMAVFNVNAFPNPSEHQFQLVVNSTSNEPVEIKVFDIVGKQVAMLKKNIGEPIKFGQELKTGTYIAEVIQGSQRKTIKLIKQ